MFSKEFLDILCRRLLLFDSSETAEVVPAKRRCALPINGGRAVAKHDRVQISSSVLGLDHAVEALDQVPRLETPKHRSDGVVGYSLPYALPSVFMLGCDLVRPCLRSP